jgi:hypothetical protein
VEGGRSHETWSLAFTDVVNNRNYLADCLVYLMFSVEGKHI